MKNIIETKKEKLQIAAFGYGMFLVVFASLVFFLSGSFLHLMLIWNICLAFVPLYISTKLSKKKSTMNILLWIIWLLFIPNTFYMITDVIHLQQISFIELSNPYEYTYIKDISIWLELVNILLCVSTGVIFGMMSMQNVKKVIKGKSYMLLLPFISIASGIAIYIGRFLRFNSWDILQPISLLQRLYANMDFFAIQYILLFSGIIFFINIGYYVLKHYIYID